MAIPATKWLAPAVLALAACAPKVWTKPDTGADQVALDKRACEQQATMEVQRQQNRSASTMGPAVVGGPATGAQARRFNTTPQGPFADQRGTQLADEDRLVAECMRDKGYQQVKSK